MSKKLPIVKSEEQGRAYRAAHVSQRLLSPLGSARLHADGERSHDVTAELHRDATALQHRAGRDSAAKLDMFKCFTNFEFISIVSYDRGRSYCIGQRKVKLGTEGDLLLLQCVINQQCSKMEEKHIP